MTFQDKQAFENTLLIHAASQAHTKDFDYNMKSLLRDYQQQGVLQLLLMFDQGFNPLLADEMGLGKTIQALAVLQCLLSQKTVRHCLLVVPLSLLRNWIDEFNAFLPDCRVLSLVGSMEERQQFTATVNADQMDVLLTTYDIVNREMDFLLSIDWDFMILDVIHHSQFIHSKGSA
jgi:SNF2 family DNA or RNA helicase